MLIYPTYSVSMPHEQLVRSKQASLMPISTNLGMLTTTAAKIAGIMYTRALKHRNNVKTEKKNKLIMRLLFSLELGLEVLTH